MRTLHFGRLEVAVEVTFWSRSCNYFQGPRYEDGAINPTATHSAPQELVHCALLGDIGVFVLREGKGNGLDTEQL